MKVIVKIDKKDIKDLKKLYGVNAWLELFALIIKEMK
jgi:hypothetical protein